jgi:hypothetical protein
VLPEQGQSLGALVCSRASSRRHGAATSSARACRLGHLILPVGCGYSPAPVATAIGAAKTTRQAVATANAPARPRNVSLAAADGSTGLGHRAQGVADTPPGLGQMTSAQRTPAQRAALKQRCPEQRTPAMVSLTGPRHDRLLSD